MVIMAPKHKEGDERLVVSGKWISWLHTVSAYAAFLGAFVVGVHLHYHKIVENEYYVSLLSSTTYLDIFTIDLGLS